MSDMPLGYLQRRWRRWRRVPYHPVLDFEDDGGSWSYRQRRGSRGWRGHVRWLRKLPGLVQFIIALLWLSFATICGFVAMLVGGGLFYL
jgi:hypothetical protein